MKNIFSCLIIFCLTPLLLQCANEEDRYLTDEEFELLIQEMREQEEEMYDAQFKHINTAFEEENPQFTSKFEGSWEGKYQCAEDLVVDDQLTITKNKNRPGFKIIVHSDFAYPSTVTGFLTSENKIIIPEQYIEGVPAEVEIHYSEIENESLEYSQTALNYVCQGKSYTKLDSESLQSRDIQSKAIYHTEYLIFKKQSWSSLVFSAVGGQEALEQKLSDAHDLDIIDDVLTDKMHQICQQSLSVNLDDYEEVKGVAKSASIEKKYKNLYRVDFYLGQGRFNRVPGSMTIASGECALIYNGDSEFELLASQLLDIKPRLKVVDSNSLGINILKNREK